MNNKSRNIVLVIVIFITVLLVYNFVGYNSNIDAPYQEYLRRVKHKRKEIETFMENDPSSPFKEGIRYTGLNFFPIDTIYRVKAKYKYLEGKDIITLVTTQQKLRSYIPWIRLSFVLENKEQSLTLYKSVGFEVNDPYFLPFTDLTNQSTTYGMGRYLNMKNLPSPKDKKEHIILDFNLTYNPFCAYNKQYSCPIPPEENRLNVLINAGEKLFR